MRIKISEIKENIKSIKIQGATNVALATLEGIKLVVNEGNYKTSSELLEEVERVGIELSTARENEPLARNGVKFLLGKLKDYESVEEAKKHIVDVCDEYVSLIKKAKEKIFESGVKELKGKKVVLTHCHSSTTTKILIELSKKNPKLVVVSTETRPLYQGRLTAKELSAAGVKTYQIVDSAAPSFIEDDRYLPVECVIVGNDELLSNGNFVNKVGTYSMALSALVGKDEFYVATSLLKLDLSKNPKFPEIEMRPGSEVWNEAPEGLQIINPSFDMVDSKYVTGYITEAGVISVKEIKEKALKLYPWLK